MRVNVGINTKNRIELKTKLDLAKKFFPKNTSLHVDISKKGFSSVNSFVDFAILKKYSRYFKLEGHLMVTKKDVLLHKWYLSPLKTLFIHSAISPDWEKVFRLAKKYHKEIGVVVDFDQSLDGIFVPVGTKRILVLAVVPGKSGQKFHTKALSVISFLRKKYPHAKISVDGGITLQIARKVKLAGANGVTSESFIWKNKNPELAYKKLRDI